MNNFVQSCLTKLEKNKIPNPELDLRILLRHASYKKKEMILSNFKLNDINIKYFNYLFNRRLNNQPISKITKKKSFWKSDFYVNSDVLDPRPESELIIEEVLNLINNKHKTIEILDIGTGSGCLALSLALEFKNANILGIDISEKAIKVAKKNRRLLKISNRKVKFKLAEIENINSKYDIIVSNPPYLTFNEYNNSQIEIKNFEPKLALIGGNDGLKFYRLFAKKIEKILHNGSFFICEIGYKQLNSCKDIFKNTNLDLKKVSKDIQKNDRTLTFLKI